MSGKTIVKMPPAPPIQTKALVDVGKNTWFLGTWGGYSGLFFQGHRTLILFKERGHILSWEQPTGLVDEYQPVDVTLVVGSD